ncbi:diguanylate cyclase [Pseudarthrobacter psychrotolerans]|uniref:Diguanylate cyclase n=1 Tax=Pseudarthrobacter psychrotolerans TaxID=2697569 RepID=A0A6P1NNN5_9MICC|nr:diguanylate cyclase [Pseudarthrobacter psychrotolerans]QHK20868.1 diguanylate cyclase [Pseudarthrobacter psychrotolerans]
MVLDTTTLRIAFALMALLLGLLFYFFVYRTTHAPYSGWWCVALALFLTGALAFLLDGTPLQRWANPMGHVLLVSGAVSVWSSARTLRRSPPEPLMFVAAPAATLVACALDSPATNTWAGGPVFLASMALMFGLATREMWPAGPAYTRVRIPMTASVGLVSVFYTGRLIAFLTDGPGGPTFELFFGSAITTMFTMVLLVVVSFSMAGLISEQQTRALHMVATRDDLTGLLNRKAFLDLAAAVLKDPAATQGTGALILADLDHFKSVNDTHGHAAGDLALQAFAGACRDTVRSADLVGRYGGEEFVLLIPGASAGRAESIAGEVSRRLAQVPTVDGLEMPTVSYGVALYDAGTSDVEDFIAAADRALYVAKSRGRNRTVHSDRIV